MRTGLGFLLGILAMAGSLAADDGPRVFYSRQMPAGPFPHIQITVDRNGAVVYRQAPDDPTDQPVEFQLRPQETDEIFALAEKLDYFTRPLESNLKVANMGLKTFRYEHGEKRHEQQFNFSQDADARLLADWFARIIETEQHFLNLERSTRFDKLGVNQVLLQLQATMERNRLVAAGQFLPLLDKVANNESYLNMARNRAAMLAEVVRGAADGRKP